LSLNVCGVNRRLQYGEFVKFLSSYDVKCLTETKTDDTDVLHIPGFSVFLKNRCKLSNVRSGGIALLFRDSLVKHVTEIKRVLGSK
jgi:exonuclease III